MTVQISTDAAVTTLRIDRPNKKNALDSATYRALAAGLADAAGDDRVRAVILTGGPEVFTAGNDLADFIAIRQGGGDLPATDFLKTLVRYPKPIVAAVAGWAVGIGTTMLLHCDLVYAAPSARFKTPFVDLGLCPEAGSSALLPRLIGPRHAIEMLYLGVEVDAARALAWGLVTEVVDDPLARAGEIAAALAARPPNALRKTKELIRRVERSTVETAMVVEAEAFVEQLSSDEARDAVMAMMARRR